MANKHVYLDKVAIGDELVDQVYRLKYFRPVQGGVNIILADKSGELKCYLSEVSYEPQMKDYVGGAVKVHAVILNGNHMIAYGKIKSLSLADKGTFKASDIFDGLSEEKVKQYLADIADCKKYISEPSCLALVNAILTEETLKKLSVWPASIAYHGKYRGGALATAAAVTKMLLHSGNCYLKERNGIYQSKVDWSLLITASLIHTSGVLGYITEQPWKKTTAGLERGYMSILQSVIESAVRKNNINISDDTLSALLNILGCAVSMKTSVKSTKPEGSIFRSVLMLYEELDMMAAGAADHESEDGETYFWDYRLKKCVTTNSAKGGAA